VSRQADCGPADARARAKIARKYLEMAELATQERPCEEEPTGPLSCNFRKQT
jgi:hypothetical protein